MTTYYLHTIDGKPAYYEEGRQIVFARCYGKAAPLVTTLKQIRKEQELSAEWRENEGLPHYYDYGHQRVSI